MKVNLKKSMIFPELFVFFIVESVFVFVVFVVFIVCVILQHNDDLVLIVVLSIVLLGSSVTIPILGLIAGVFDYFTLDENNFIIIRCGKIKRIIPKTEIASISQTIGFRGMKFVRFDLVKNIDDVSKDRRRTYTFSYSQNKWDIIHAWYWSTNEEEK